MRVHKGAYRDLKIRQLLKIPRFSKIEEIFFKLLCGLRFSPKSFYFFFNRIARYAQSKESRNLSSKIPQITCKAIFRSCLNKERKETNMVSFLIIFDCIHKKNMVAIIFLRRWYCLPTLRLPVLHLPRQCCQR